MVEKRIGITVRFQFSYFSAGSPGTALAMAETLRVKGNDVKFINVGGETEKGKKWWDDLLSMEKEWSSIHESDLLPDMFDIIIEVGNNFLSNGSKKKALLKNVWMPRKAALFNDIESCLFPQDIINRNLNHVSEVWLIDEFTSKDDVQYIELLTRKKVVIVPFIWTPVALEAHRQETKSPLWHQVASMEGEKDKPLSIHICETNVSSSSSCTIPLLIMREVAKKSLSLSLNPKVKIHNAANVNQSKFFRENVLAHVFSDIGEGSLRNSVPFAKTQEGMVPEFLGRQRIIDWVYDPKSIVISHMRFMNIRPYLLDCLWVGIPLVHNSTVLRDLDASMANSYYRDNELLDGRKAFERVAQNLVATTEELIRIRKILLERFSPLSDRIGVALQEALDAPVYAGTVVSFEEVVSKAKEKKYYVGFSDMWADFKADYNMFLLMLRAAIVDVEVIGVDLSDANMDKLDILIFGPFGEKWKTVPEKMPKVHFTGENTGPIKEANLNIGFRHLDGNDGSYLRLPLWMIEINWFRADAERIGNPKPISIDRCTKVVPFAEAKGDRSKFCSFIVTNPRQPMRNNSFKWLSNYKKVDSAGRLFNNMGDSLFAGLGGGGGEIKKFNFLKEYKFSLTYENESSNGYTTEKMLHAKAAGCIPIYWGDPRVERDFDPSGFIDARNFTTEKELIDGVKEVDENDELWMKKYNVPALDDIRRDIVRRTLSECASRMWTLMGISPEKLLKIPKFLGYMSDSDSVLVPSSKETKSTTLSPTFGEVFITGCNKRFLPVLDLWLRGVEGMKKTAAVYFMEDVLESEKLEILAKFSSTIKYSYRIPSVTSEEFPDIWSPQHFAWKIWLLKEVQENTELRGRTCIYLDTGALVMRLPGEWLSEMMNSEGKISVLEDPREDNDHWCHDVFKNTLNMTEEERRAKQIWAGSIAFQAGSVGATTLFNDAWKLAQKREIIVGDKWSSRSADGSGGRRGHRHDQSIVSLLILRQKLLVHRYPLDKVYCDVSARHTYLKGCSFYVHRGNFLHHQAFTKGIDDIWIINLDRRKDRLEKFNSAHVEIANRTLRMPAFDGKLLELMPKLARLFAVNDFGWKKSVMGCALSHLALWTQLAMEKPEVNSYLILEDDAVLKPEWKMAWDNAASSGSIPENADVVYLGGILPPNRSGFENSAIEKVNEHVGRVKENTMFGQNPANRYFHFCAYAYVLTKSGAKKILDVLRYKNGYWTSADHMMCNIPNVLNMYFLNPLPAGCYQDEDPVYQKSVFNDFSRVDSFDSDLWNNKDVFTEDEKRKVLSMENEIDILGALEEARNVVIIGGKSVSANELAKQKQTQGEKQGESGKISSSLNGLNKGLQRKLRDVKSLKEVSSELSEKEVVSVPVSVPCEEMQEIPQVKGRRFVSVVGEKMNITSLYEYSWFKELFEKSGMSSLEIDRIPAGEVPTDEPIVIVQRPFTEEIKKVLKGWSSVKFYILHLSDEFGSDPIDFYEWPEVLGVLRNYVREDLVESEKVKVIPLGFHWAIPNGEPYIHTPRPPFREFIWSFVGTGWANRRDKLAPLRQLPLASKEVFMDQWNSPKMLGRQENLSILLNSWFVACPLGNNAETYRFYEALEAGSVPIVVREEKMEGFLKMIAASLPLLIANSWSHAAEIVYILHSKPEMYEEYRNNLLYAWEMMKKNTKENVKNVFKLQ